MSTAPENTKPDSVTPPPATPPGAEPQATTPPATPDAKVAPPADGKAAAPASDKPVAPEKYDLKAPKDSLLTPEHLEKVAAYAKAQGFSQEQAQAYLERENQVLSDFQKGQMENLAKQTQAWVSELKQDKDFGGDAFNRNVELSHRALEKFADKDFVEMLDKTGLGNHPGLVRTFLRIGKLISEDSFVRAPNAPASKKSPEEILYPSSAQ